MTTFTAFCKKELLESARTWRLWGLLAAFLALGLMSPLLAKLLPDLLSGADIGGTTIQLPEATAFDSWTQFFKNIAQLGGLVLLIVFSGLTAGEFSRGTLVMVLAKGAGRTPIVLAKLAVAGLAWTASYGLALATTWGYNAYYWGTGGLNHAGLAFVSPWLFGLMMVALLALGGIMAKNLLGALGVALGVYIGLNLINIAPAAARFNPVSLAGGTLALLNGQAAPSDFWPAVGICGAAIVAAVVASLLVFNQKQI